MKTFYKTITCLSLISLLALSCSEKDLDYGSLDFDSDTFVVFAESSLSVNELVTEPIAVEALYAASSSSANTISVPFTISSDNAVEGVDYTIVDNKTSFDFSNGNLSDVVYIMPIDESNPTGNKQLTFELNSGAVNLGYPGPAANNKTVVLTIVDNDCPYTLEELGAASWSGSDNASGDEGPNASQILTSYENDTTFYFEGISYGWITNVNYWDEVVVTSNLVEADFDTATGAITIALQPLCTTTWNGATQPDYSIQATGSYDSCGETITLDYDLIQGGAILRSYTETITK
ncbi:hypothetical protein [uncultured Olleya sp.]|uniref:hypothetical protein n=1 Tax=uncultured Olleya sp. TaxID=757243 RepID=UPI002594C14A|nr:hypothetical protein [uncultured Olleya sp.]